LTLVFPSLAVVLVRWKGRVGARGGMVEPFLALARLLRSARTSLINGVEKLTLVPSLGRGKLSERMNGGSNTDEGGLRAENRIVEGVAIL
jgi:hypothetical protein